MLLIKQLSVEIAEKKIINDINLHVAANQTHVIMGPNGSGKSSLALTLMGHSRYKIVTGNIALFEEEITCLAPDKRAQLGLFLSMQQPCEIPGVNVLAFLQESYRALGHPEMPHVQFRAYVLTILTSVGLTEAFLDRNLNDGFSGGEKKRFEIVQLLLSKPKLAVLDEIDSGLDIDALKLIAQALLSYKVANPDVSFVFITHYQRICEFIQPDVVHIMIDGTFKRTGDHRLAALIDDEGYHAFF